jgi:hypothetical protein
VCLVTALLAYVGCSSSNTANPSPADPGATPVRVAASDAGSGSGSGAAGTSAGTTPDPGKGKGQEADAAGKKASAVRPPFPGWPEPAGALVISGEQFGYLEPCGCTQGQLGGLLRRYDFVERLREGKKWPLALADLGSLIKDPSSARGGPEQTKVKFNTALKALGLLRYDALALSPEDLKIGADEAVVRFTDLPPGGPKVVAANVTSTVEQARVVPSVRKAVGPVKLGITAAVDPAALQALKDPALNDLLEVKPIDQALPGVLADLEKDTDTQVLLVQGAPELAKTLAEKYPGFDVVVGTSAGSDPPVDPETLNNGKTLLITVGHKGKFVGVVGLFQGPGPRYRYQRVMLDPAYDGAAAPMKALVEDDFREALKQQGLVENFPRHEFVNAVAGAQGATFVGVGACKECHPKTVEFWESTKHAQAFESLVHDKKPNTIYDVECVSCHTTGFEYTSGWKSEAATPYLKGNQCENCHGPGSKHVADPRNKQFRASMHVTAEQADKNRLCLHCHDEDNDPHFDFAKYWAEIEHNGLDLDTLKKFRDRPAKAAK